MPVPLSSSEKRLGDCQSLQVPSLAFSESAGFLRVDSEQQISETDRPIRVDFLGPPGVGKSRLCKSALGDTCISRRGWVGIDETRVLAENNVYRHSLQSMQFLGRIRLFMALLRYGTRNYLIRGQRRPFVSSRKLERIQISGLHRFLEDFGPLFEAMVEQWFDPDMKLPCRAVRYDDLLHWTRDWLFLVNWSGPVLFLADNSRFTRGVSELLSNVRHDPSRREELAGLYLASPLGPQGIVHIDAASDLVLERIRDREQKKDGWRNTAHRGLSDGELLSYSDRRSHVNARAVRFFRSQGVAVLSLCGDSPLEEKTAELREFLSTLNDGTQRRVDPSLS